MFFMVIQQISLFNIKLISYWIEFKRRSYTDRQKREKIIHKFKLQEHIRYKEM